VDGDLGTHHTITASGLTMTDILLETIQAEANGDLILSDIITCSTN
jgi:hypothetical protein